MDIAFNFWLSVIVISIVGTLAHFLYEWSGRKRIIGLFTAVNESTWEHIKIALTPTLLWSLYDGFIYGSNPNYFCAKLFSVIVITILIPTIFYTYKKLLKKDYPIVDIAIFYCAIIMSQLLFYGIISLNPMWQVFRYLSCIGLFIFFGCYMTLTLEPIRNIIFRDPITNRYGFKAHSNIFKKHKKHPKKS